MLTKNIAKQPKSIIEISITVPWQDLEGRWNETLQKMAVDLELPGFRKGQAPLNLAEQNLGGKLQDEFLKVVMPALLVEALQGENIIPIDYPKYQMTSFIKGQQLSFKARITERPEIKITDYKAIKVIRPPVKTITDDDVNKLIDDLFTRWKTRQPAVDTSQNAQSSGGSISFNQPQPQPLNTQGQNEPDDTFAKAMGAVSLADLKARLKVDLENEAKFNNELDFEELILQEVEKRTIADVPEILVEDELRRMMVSLQRRVSDMGLLIDDYLKSQGKTVEGLKNDWRVQAERNVKMELGLSEIAHQEKVEITDEQLRAEIDKIQDARLKKQFEAEQPRLHLRHSLRQMKTLDLLKDLVKTPQ